ncbi:MAG TPA: regulatory protein RecX [Gemmatimonadaceae bacterium]|jgi:regulatory protein|nr:regulatory protein RecX [Gemmatimonadaceae bacterium]
MPVVTAIVPHARRPGRFAVAVDGADAATVGIDAIERLALRVGVDVTERLLAALVDETAAVAVYDQAVRLLAGRGYAVAELSRRLKRHGAEARHVAAAIERLTAAGALDDAEYARSLTRSRVRSRGASARRVKQELSRHGVAADVAAEAVEQVFVEEEVDVAAVVERLAQRRAETMRDLDPAVRRRRLYAYLARRGYDADVVRRAVETVIERK